MVLMTLLTKPSDPSQIGLSFEDLACKAQGSGTSRCLHREGCSWKLLLDMSKGSYELDKPLDLKDFGAWGFGFRVWGSGLLVPENPKP